MGYQEDIKLKEVPWVIAIYRAIVTGETISIENVEKRQKIFLFHSL